MANIERYSPKVGTAKRVDRTQFGGHNRVGKAIDDLARNVGNAGAILARSKALSDKDEEQNVGIKFKEFQANSLKAAQLASSSADEQGKGAVHSFYESGQELRDQFMAEVPERLKGSYTTLTNLSLDQDMDAVTQQRTADYTAYVKQDFEDTMETIVGSAITSQEDDNLASAVAFGLTKIDTYDLSDQAKQALTESLYSAVSEASFSQKALGIVTSDSLKEYKKDVADDANLSLTQQLDLNKQGNEAFIGNVAEAQKAFDSQISWLQDQAALARATGDTQAEIALQKAIINLRSEREGVVNKNIAKGANSLGKALKKVSDAGVTEVQNLVALDDRKGARELLVKLASDGKLTKEGFNLARQSVFEAEREEEQKRRVIDMNRASSSIATTIDLRGEITDDQMWEQIRLFNDEHRDAEGVEAATSKLVDKMWRKTAKDQTSDLDNKLKAAEFYANNGDIKKYQEIRAKIDNTDYPLVDNVEGKIQASNLIVLVADNQKQVANSQAIFADHIAKGDLAEAEVFVNELPTNSAAWLKAKTAMIKSLATKNNSMSKDGSVGGTLGVSAALAAYNNGKPLSVKITPKAVDAAFVSLQFNDQDPNYVKNLTDFITRVGVPSGIAKDFREGTDDPEKLEVMLGVLEELRDRDDLGIAGRRLPNSATYAVALRMRENNVDTENIAKYLSTQSRLTPEQKTAAQVSSKQSFAEVGINYGGFEDVKTFEGMKKEDVFSFGNEEAYDDMLELYNAYNASGDMSSQKAYSTALAKISSQFGATGVTGGTTTMPWNSYGWGYGSTGTGELQQTRFPIEAVYKLTKGDPKDNATASKLAIGMQLFEQMGDTAVTRETSFIERAALGYAKPESQSDRDESVWSKGVSHMMPITGFISGQVKQAYNWYNMDPTEYAAYTKDNLVTFKDMTSMQFKDIVVDNLVAEYSRTENGKPLYKIYIMDGEDKQLVTDSFEPNPSFGERAAMGIANGEDFFGELDQ